MDKAWSKSHEHYHLSEKITIFYLGRSSEQTMSRGGADTAYLNCIDG